MESLTALGTLTGIGVISLLVGLRARTLNHKPKILAGVDLESTSENFPERPTKTHFYNWGHRFLDFRQLTMGGLIVGAPGSGKTVTIKLLLKNVLPRIHAGQKVSAVVYDSKTDLLPFLMSSGVRRDRGGYEPFLPHAMVGDSDKVIILNPLDKRAKAWDMAADITDRFQIETFAAHLIPAPESLGQNRYFNQAAQTIAAQVMLALHIQAKGKWRLKDLVIVCRNERLMRHILGIHPATRACLDEHFNESNSFQSVKSTLGVYMGEYESIALAWDRCFPYQTFVTLEWVKQSRLLVLGNNHRAKVPLRRLNTLILSQLQSHVMDLSGEPDRESWFVLDEFRELGKIESFNDFLITCRGKRAPVILGFQDIGGLEELYGERNAREILACTNNVAIFHINNSNPQTQEWAAKVLGDWEIKDTSVSASIGYSGDQSQRSVSKNRSTVRQTRWMPSQFSIDLKMLSNGGVLTGLYSVNGEWNLPEEIKEETLFMRPDKSPLAVPADDPEVLAFDKFELEELPAYCRWNEEDFSRLAIPSLKSLYGQILNEPEDEDNHKSSAPPSPGRTSDDIS